MSVVVAIKESGKIYMGADTMVTYGDSKRYLTTDHTQKVWVVEDTPNCIMGCVGLLSDLNLIRYCGQHLVPELAVLKNEVNTGLIIQTTVPQLFGLIKDYNEVCGKPEEHPIQSSFVIGVKDHLFTIFPDGCVEEEEDWVAIGSGADMALASLENTVGEDVYIRLIKALSAASRISLYVDDPYVLVDNDKLEMSILNYEELLVRLAEECDCDENCTADCKCDCHADDAKKCDCCEQCGGPNCHCHEEKIESAEN